MVLFTLLMAGKIGKAIYRSRRWAQVRLIILDRAGWRCESCGRAAPLEVHHRVPLADGGAPYAQQNLRAVCRPCHYGEHSPPVPADVLAWRELIADGT